MRFRLDILHLFGESVQTRDNQGVVAARSGHVVARIEQLRASAEEVASWPRRRSALMSLALAWGLHAPRYRGAVPRWLGRTVGRHMHDTIRTVSGGIVAVEPSCLDIYTTSVERGGVWEPLIHNICKAMVKPGETLLDIGANAGVLSIDVAAHFAGKVKVVSFEPMPWLAQRIALSAELSGLADVVSVYDVMLGETAGEATLYVPTHHTMASAVARTSDATPLKRRVERLDDLVEAGIVPRPDAIKIDVEGAELGVFKGAAKTLASAMPTLLFEADSNMQRFNYGRRELLALLSSFGPYRYFYATTRGPEPLEDLDAPLDDDDHSNILAVAPGREVPRFTNKLA